MFSFPSPNVSRDFQQQTEADFLTAKRFRDPASRRNTGLEVCTRMPLDDKSSADNGGDGKPPNMVIVSSTVDLVDLLEVE